MTNSATCRSPESQATPASPNSRSSLAITTSGSHWVGSHVRGRERADRARGAAATSAVQELRAEAQVEVGVHVAQRGRRDTDHEQQDRAEDRPRQPPQGDDHEVPGVARSRRRRVGYCRVVQRIVLVEPGAERRVGATWLGARLFPATSLIFEATKMTR